MSHKEILTLYESLVKKYPDSANEGTVYTFDDLDEKAKELTPKKLEIYNRLRHFDEETKFQFDECWNQPSNKYFFLCGLVFNEFNDQELDIVDKLTTKKDASIGRNNTVFFGPGDMSQDYLHQRLSYLLDNMEQEKIEWVKETFPEMEQIVIDNLKETKHSSDFNFWEEFSTRARLNYSGSTSDWIQDAINDYWQVKLSDKDKERFFQYNHLITGVMSQLRLLSEGAITIKERENMLGLTDPELDFYILNTLDLEFCFLD